MAFGNASDGGVAGHLRDEVDVQGVEGGLEAHAGAGDGGLASGVSGADDYYVEIFGEGHGDLFYRVVRVGDFIGLDFDLDSDFDLDFDFDLDSDFGFDSYQGTSSDVPTRAIEEGGFSRCGFVLPRAKRRRLF